MTFDEAYSPAMRIETQEEADRYFEKLVFAIRFGSDGISVEDAEALARTNLGYWAGYHDNETRERVERLFRCEHPVFGSIAEKGPPTMEEAFRLGKEWAKDTSARRGTKDAG